MELLRLFLTAATLLFAAIGPVRAQEQEQDFNLLELSRVPDVYRATGLALQGRYLYVIGYDALYVLDTTDPASPTVLGSVDGLGNTRQIAVDGGYAYITAREGGLWIVDIRDPRKPRIARRFDTVEMATGIDVAGGVCFVGQRQYGIEFIDVRDPENPRHIRTLKTDESQSVKYCDGLLYSGDWGSGKLTIIDVHNIAQARIISVTSLDGYGDGVDVSGRYCYAATGHHARKGDMAMREGRGHGVEIYDVSNPRHPVLMSVTKFPPVYHNANDFWIPRVSGNILVVSDTMNGAFVLDVTNKLNPRIIYRIIIKDPQSKFPSAVIGNAIPGDGVIYVAGSKTGLYVARLDGVKRAPERNSTVIPKIPARTDYTNDPNIFITYRAENPAQARNVAVDGDIAYLAYSDNGLHILRLSDWEIEKIGGLDIPSAYDVKVTDGKVYVAEGAGGLGIYRIDGPGKLTEIGRLKEAPDRVHPMMQNVWVYPGSKFAVVSYLSSTLYFVDISDPTAPKIVYKNSKRGLLYNDYLPDALLEGRYLGVLRHSGGFIWFDLSGDLPRETHYTTGPVSSLYDGTATFRDKILLSNRGRFTLLDPNADAPRNNKEYTQLPEGIRGTPRIDGNTLTLTCRIDRRSKCYDISDPSAPKMIESRCYDYKGHPAAPAFWHHRMLIPAGYEGLLLERKYTNNRRTYP